MLDFEVGDIVVLRSGGPDMTVSAIDDSGQVRCWWVDGDGMTHESVFEPECLEAA